MMPRLLVATVVLGLIAVAAEAQRVRPKPPVKAGKVVKPDNDWTGKVTDNKKVKDAPAKGYITEKDAFEKLWKSWRGDEKVPTVDFTKKIVIVTVSTGGPNVPRITARLNEGNLQVLAISTKLAGPGFGYSIAVFDKEGIKKLNGKEVK